MSKKSDENLSYDELFDKYDILKERHNQLKKDNEELLQEIHTLKWEKSRLVQAEKFLQSELETINSAHSKELSEINEKQQQQIDNLKHKDHDLISENIRLEAKCDELSAKLEDLEQELKESKVQKPSPPPKERLSDVFMKEVEFERIIQELTEINEEQKNSLDVLTKQNSENAAVIEELKDKILCLEDNLESKKSELNEKEELFESLQQQVNELNIELTMYKTAPESDNRKGNSLFAEVDDQRQKMKQILQAQNQTYNDMKKAYNMQKIEIRRLKNENSNIKQEIQACSNLFHRAEQVYSQTLSSKNSQLMNENRTLIAKLKMMEKTMSEVAKNNGLEWIESLMKADESRATKEKLFNLMMQKNELDDNFQKSQKDLAQIRLKCVKMKLLLGRIVDLYNIKLDEIDTSDIHLDAEMMQNIRKEHEKSVLETTMARFEDETVVFVSDSKENPEIVSLDDTNTTTIFNAEAKNQWAMVSTPVGRPAKLTFAGTPGRKIPNLKTPVRMVFENTDNPLDFTPKYKYLDVPQANSINDEKPLKRRADSVSPDQEIPTKIMPVASSFVKDEKPLHEISNFQQPASSSSSSSSINEKHHVKFSEVVETKHIDSTLEQFQQSVNARKKSVITVKRITIPSRTVKKET